ncbi:MAG TPA: hypothetical protein VHG29_08820 [Novosphingobium sp.]|nr:hypothetical protein [Novosphingobium sp.]
MELVLSILVLACIALIMGAVVLLRRGGSRKQAGLMLLLAAIMAVNVAIWTLPVGGTSAPLEQELK